MGCSLYIHIPFCKTKCDYCDFFSIPCGNNPVPDSYVNALCHEIKSRVKSAGLDGVDTVYIGGGTPSLLSVFQLNHIMETVYSLCVKKPFEITIEVNPDDITEKMLKDFDAAGINRISVGIQAFDDPVLKGVKRRSSEETVYSALDVIKKYWKGIFSADVIAALPGQTKDSFLKGLEKLCSYKPHHISMYSLTIEDETPLGKAFFSGKISYDSDMADEMWLEGREFLELKGYGQYEVSNFSQKGFECAHNMVYWKLKDYLGCGAGGTGTLYGENGLRFTNTTDIVKYTEYWTSEKSAVEAPGVREDLNIETQEFEFFMMGLRTLAGISESDFTARYGHEVPQTFVSLMRQWEKSGRAEIKESESDRIFTLNKKGILFLNAFLEKLM